MQTFHLSRIDEYNRDEFWLTASSAAMARRLLALNVTEAKDAEDGDIFDCDIDDTKLPPEGLIYHSHDAPTDIVNW